jgi:hypothetical protein
MQAFDHVCNAFLRARDDAISRQTYDGALSQFMASQIGKLASPVSREEQKGNAGSPSNWGNGCQPARPSALLAATFDVALNKIKHRIDEYSNFRIGDGRHLLVVGGDRNRRPDYLFEFDVIEFCDLCDGGCALIM